MQYQEKRSIVFLTCNIAMTTLYVLFLFATQGSRMTLLPGDLSILAMAALGFIPLQIVMRIVIMIGFAVSNEVTANKEPLDLEDEMDKLIDLKASVICGNVFMAGIFLALASQAFGMPAGVMVMVIACSMAVSGFVGDAIQFVMYRRGV